MTSVETLSKMKAEIEDSKNKQARLEGELEGIENRLKEMGLESIEEAKKKLDALEDEEEQIVSKIEEAVENLKKQYDWKTI